jgi:hypothetical protein
VQLLLAAENLAAEVLAGAAQAAAAAGHTELAIVLLKSVVAQDSPAPATAAAVLIDQSVASGVLELWEAAESAIREEEARWPELQQLVIGIARTHQQLQSVAAAAEITTPEVSPGVQAGQKVVDDHPPAS